MGDAHRSVYVGDMTQIDAVLRAPALITSGREVTDGWVAVAGERIHSVGTGEPPEAVRTITASGYLVPGFVDIHVHGGATRSFDDGADAIADAAAFHRSHGTTRSIVSLVTAGLTDLQHRVRAAAEAIAADPLLIGIHLEGPYLSVNHRGAHDESLLAQPTGADVDALIAAADDRLAMVTIAPELPGAPEAIEHLLAAGVRIAVGHSAVDYDQAAAAFDSGATLLTHACNGMRPLHHREPGPVLAAVDAAGVTLEVINDGAHVHPRVVRLLQDLAGDRLAYITDAMAASGCPDGAYDLGGQAVTVTGGVPRLDSNGSIAGSTLTMDAAVRQGVRIGLPLVDAVRSATAIPARALGLDDAIGALEPGFLADAVFLDADLQVEQVWAGGTAVSGGQ